MLQEHSPAHRAEVPPTTVQEHVTTLVTALAVGLTVGLAVLAAFIGAFLVRDDQPAQPNQPAGAATPGSTGLGRTATGAPRPTAAASKNTQPTPPGSQVLPGTPAAGAQLWAKRPLDAVHQDQGSSIALPKGRALWIFADTFQLYNDPKFFITSSAGLTTGNSLQLHYSVRKGVPTEFLPRTAAERADRKDGDHYQAVWPTGSTQLPDGRIIISYARYRVLVKQKNFEFLGGGLFEYRYRGPAALIAGGHATRIASDLWTPEDGEVRSPLYADGYVYFNECRDLRCRSLRTTGDRLADRSSYRWWTGTEWSSNRDRAQDLVYGTNHPGGNPSVVRLRSGGYVTADTEAGAVAGRGLIWVAAHPWGPWSPAAAFDFPRCLPPGCYGLNLHPEQSTTEQLRISYATNGEGPFVRVVDVPVWISPDSTAILVR